MSEQQQNIKIVISVRNIDKKYTFPHYLGTYCTITTATTTNTTNARFIVTSTYYFTWYMIHFLPLQEGYENIADREQIVTEIKKNREKNQVKQVSNGQECGITVKDYMDFQKNDTIEAFNVTSKERTI